MVSLSFCCGVAFLAAVPLGRLAKWASASARRPLGNLFGRRSRKTPGSRVLDARAPDVIDMRSSFASSVSNALDGVAPSGDFRRRPIRAFDEYVKRTRASQLLSTLYESREWL